MYVRQLVAPAADLERLAQIRPVHLSPLDGDVRMVLHVRTEEVVLEHLRQRAELIPPLQGTGGSTRPAGLRALLARLATAGASGENGR